MPTLRPLRLGITYPLGGAEYDYYQFADSSNGKVRTYLVGARIFGEGKDHDIEHLQRTGSLDNLRDAALGLVPLTCDAAVWACTSGSFVDGRAHAEAQAQAIGAVTGCPASSTSLAFAAALQEIGAKRVAIVASYPEPAARAFVKFLSEFGIDAPRLVWLDAPAGPDAARFGAERLLAASQSLDLTDVDAILVPDTALPGIELSRLMTEQLGKPCLTANQVTLWEA
ncbi:maleate cis-trans isomerase family protein [Rhizobium panacihumi]|uniref:maleate cis-trans isomerase family protein n=1 Tax=Rhizobium panacihumi TaxID=2008450 RepID=UPI003D7A4142